MENVGRTVGKSSGRNVYIYREAATEKKKKLPSLSKVSRWICISKIAFSRLYLKQNKANVNASEECASTHSAHTNTGTHTKKITHTDPDRRFVDLIKSGYFLCFDLSSSLSLFVTSIPQVRMTSHTL